MAKRRGMIFDAARREGRNFFTAALVLTVICGAVLGLNWRYVYNWFAGPVAFTRQLADAPGAREWVHAEGVSLETGVVQETTLRMLRGLVRTKNTTAQYRAMLVDGRPLVVKVPPDFSGKIVEGRLVKLPDNVRSSLPADLPWYPWLVDAETSYRWDFNLFVLVATPLFPLLVLLTLFAATRAASVDRHPAFDVLKGKGPLDAAVRAVERDLMGAGLAAKAGPLWIAPSWTVSLAPSLHIYPTKDVIGVGHTAETRKSGTVHTIWVWSRGRMLADKLDVPEADARAAIDGARLRLPGALVDDVAAFDTRWSKDRASCEREADARAPRSTAAAGRNV